MIAFRATIGQVESAFHVTLNTYTIPGGCTYYANSNDPVLPASIAGVVQSISGLNNALQWHHPPMSTRQVLPHPSTGIGQTVSCPVHGNGYVTPDQTASAYNLTGM